METYINMRKSKEFNVGFGSRLRTARNQARFTLEQLAELIDKSASFLADVERGYAGVSLKTLVKICEALNVSSDRLLWDKPSKISIDERLQFLDEAYVKIIDQTIIDQIALIRQAEKQFMPENQQEEQQDEQQEEQQNEQQGEPASDQN